MATGTIKDGDVRFARGMDSVSDPVTLPQEAYIFSTNMLNRGGAMQTRPGYKLKFRLPTGQLQGLKVFTPRVGTPSLLAFVNGVAYSSVYPFTEYRTVGGATLSALSTFVYSAATTKAVSKNADGSLTLQSPQSLLICQDGINPPCYYDGQEMIAATGAKGIPQGTHMAWVGARLWVARREQLFASDIADPLSFAETTYNTLGGQNYFILPGKCTGLAPLPSSSAVLTPLLAFTDNTTTMFQANNLNRDSWPTTPNFQSDLFPTIGCVSARSIVSHAGMLWWFTDFGMTKLDSASNSYVTSKIEFIDREMVRSGELMSDDMSGVACATYENFVMASVPHAGILNKHTWVFDSSVNDAKDETLPAAWASIWTGINPVEWVSLKINGTTHLFCASSDDDGENRIYEAFDKERRDNGCDIVWSFESRAYTGGTMQKKEFRYLEYSLSELQGQVNLKISWAGGNRGRWKTIGTPTFFAAEGNVDATRTYGATETLYGLKKQSRVERTQDVRELFNDDSLSSAGVEGSVSNTEPEKEAIDISHSVRIEGSGPCAIRAFRLFMDIVAEPDSGMAERTELDDHFVRFDGAASKDETALRAPMETFYKNALAQVQYLNWAANGGGAVYSTISQTEVEKRALQIATVRAQAVLQLLMDTYEGGSNLP